MCFFFVLDFMWSCPKEWCDDQSHILSCVTDSTAAVQVGDVADSILECVLNPGTDGKLFELGGPQVVRLQEVIDFVAFVTERKPLNLPSLLHIPLPLLALWF